MKKLFSLLLGLLPLVLSAQSFTLTSEGLRDADNIEKDFVIVSAEGKTANQLYSAAKNFINQTMKNPRMSIKGDSENEYIRYSVFFPEIITIKKLGVKLIAQAEFTIEMRFKDGRVRYNISDLYMPFKEGDKALGIKGSKWNGWFVYDNKDKLYLKDQKAHIENFFNERIAEFTAFIVDNNGDVVEDW